jgi:hypothetical protein
MQVLCKSNNERAEIRCDVCGQGFALYWERQTPHEQAEALKEVEAALKNHHRFENKTSAHPIAGFLVPAWDGPVAFSGAAMLGNAPSSAF